MPAAKVPDSRRQSADRMPKFEANADSLLQSCQSRIDTKCSLEGVISVLGTPSMMALAPAPGTLCLSTRGERVGTVHCADRRNVPTDSVVDRQEGGEYTSIGGGEARRTRVRAATPGFARSCAQATRCGDWLGRDSSGVEVTHLWAGDVLGRGPYQAVTALNSLRYRLERYPVVARRCLASTPLDTVDHLAGRRWHSDSDPAT